MSMELHFLDARGALTHHRDWLRGSLLETHAKAAALMAIQPLDVIVQTGSWVVPEKGHMGYAPRPSVIFVTVDPDNPALQANAEASLERMFAHELHHAARWDGPGYGSSLGEALISEGLAGHFAQELYGEPLEPWESLPMNEVRPHLGLAEQEWDKTDYNHEAWFFGTADRPGWSGYALGFRLVERFLSEHPDSLASKLVNTDARAFRSLLSLL